MSSTLRDIAQACDVDISTVSRALRDDPRVKKVTRDRVRQEAERLGYHPNLAARSLVAGRTRTVWFILPSLSNPREQEPAQHAGLQLREQGYDMLVALYHGEREAYRRTLRRLGQGVTDGAIIITGPQDEIEPFEPLVRANYPVIFIDRHVEGLPIPVVTSSNRTGVRELMRRAVEHGAQSFVILFGSGNPVEEARCNAALDYARMNNIPFVHGQVPEEALRDLPEPLGIIASSQSIAQNHLRANAAALQGRRLSFATFDVWVGEPFPGEVAFVCVQDFARMARVAVDQVLSMINDGTPLRMRITEIPPSEYLTVLPRFKVLNH